jgi:2-oxoisovalerate dehydrogenase E2 component (dihydrolipoyl transacylase)
MATEIKIPDLGEGIADVTVSRWRAHKGDAVKAGDVIVEVATDKVDTEIAAPADGVLLAIHHNEGEIVSLDAVLGVIGAAGEDASAAPQAAGKAAGDKAPAPASAPSAASSAPAAAAEDEIVKASPVARRVAADKGVDLATVAGTGPGGQITKGDVLARAEQGGSGSPVALPGDLANEPSLVVRRAAADLNVNLGEVAQGRPLSMLTKYDVLSAAASRAAGKEVTVTPAFPPPSAPAAAPAAAPVAPAATPAPRPAAAPAAPAVSPSPAPQLRGGEELVKHSRMRAAVARNTSSSLFSAPHVTTMWDVDMSAVLAHRARSKKEFAAAGVNLTITAYFVDAIVAGLRKVPAANASWSDEGVIIKRYYNIGMATALPADANGLGGLIVPVIKNAGDLNLLGLARAVNELAERARRNELRQDDLADGTFTLSNYGTGGSRFQTPVIVQPQVGILGVGAVEKRAVVVSNGHPLEPNMGDALVIKPMTTLGFSYDHRVLDGATADAFCAAVKERLENYQ